MTMRMSKEMRLLECRRRPGPRGERAEAPLWLTWRQVAAVRQDQRESPLLRKWQILVLSDEYEPVSVSPTPAGLYPSGVGRLTRFAEIG